MKMMHPSLMTIFFFNAQVQAQDKLLQHPIAVQFRQHLLTADTNKDGNVTKEELTKEIEKSGRSAAKAEEIVASMIAGLDKDQDGRLSNQEIEDGAKATAVKAIIRDDSLTAKALLRAIDEYKGKNHGNRPQSVDDLLEAKLISKGQSMCALGDGSEKPWIINSAAADSIAVLVYSPGSVDSEGQYIVGLVDGRVVGLHDKDLDDTILKTLQVHLPK